MNAQVRPGRFKFVWCVAGFAVLPLAAVLTALILSAIDSFNVRITNPLAPDSWAPALAIYWLVNGFCIGFLQKAIVKRNLRYDLGRWVVYSSLGGLIAGALAYPCLEGSCLPPQFYDARFAPDFAVTFELSLTALLYLTVFSAVQCLALHRIVSASWRWVAAHTGPLAIAALISLAEQMTPGSSIFNSGLAFALYVLVVTLATGIVMARMLTANRGPAQDEHDEWAYQPVPVESESPSEPSVWDDAI